LAAALFLQWNGESFQSTEENVVLKIFAFGVGAVSEADYAERLRESCRKKTKGNA
jgi:prophage maintenance system killer protein